MRAFFLIVFICFSSGVFSQPYSVENGNTRHRFAQTDFGIDLGIMQGGTSAYTDANGNQKNFTIQPQIYPRVHIGGLHFWGHAEFYFNIPLCKPLPTTIGNLKYYSQQSEFFGTKIFPWRVERNKLRPFFGFSVSSIQFQQSTNKSSGLGPSNTNCIIPALAGFTYYRKGWMLEAGASYNFFNPKFDYYLSKTQSYSAKFSPLCAWIGIRKVLETTIPMEKNYANGLTEKRFLRMKELKKLNSVFYGTGPSVAIFTGNSSYLKQDRPYLGKNLTGFVYPEIVLGYNISKLGLHVLSVCRYNGTGWKAYDTEAKMNRLAIGLEAHFKLFDYNGFVPFIGVSGGYEKLKYREWEQGQKIIETQTEKISAGIVFGWDIVPDKMQPFILRTNLRYFPGLDVGVNGKNVSLDQIEFNFIQFIYFPTRWKWIKKMNEEIQTVD